jgi:hypothetical protein
MKKEWKKPVITIVEKSTTEENVLGACKNVSFGPPAGGPQDQAWCGWHSQTGDYCHGALAS